MKLVPGAASRRLAIVGAVILASTSFGAMAQDAASPPATGDAASYFFAPLLAKEHPRETDLDASESPLVLWEGDNNSFLKASLKAEMAYFDQSNSWFGEAQANLGANSTDWYETVITPAINGSYFFDDDKGELYGRLDMVSANTEDTDAAGSNVGRGKDASHTAVENAYLGWRSGDMWSNLGKDFLDVSFGRQQYVAGTGFLFYSQGGNGGNRGGYWMGDRKASEYAGVAKFTYKQLKTDLVYFKADDNPSSDTKVGGVTVDYSLGDFGGIGGGYYSVSSDIETRDSMDVYDIRYSVTPFRAFNVADWLKPLSFEGEFVREENGNKLEADGWYLSGAYSFDDTPWKPTLTYRYSAFDGNNPNSSKNQDFDPLFYGFYDWGYWYQGEILGEYVLSNSNLKSSMVRLSADPTDAIHINLFYYHFTLDDPEGFGVQSDDFADEWNLTVDWSAGKYLSFSLVGAYASPDDGAKQYTGGDDDWAYGMLYANFSFK